MWRPIGAPDVVPSRRALHVGVRLGPPSRHSAFAVIETNADDVLRLLHLERHTGTYPSIVGKLKDLIGRLPKTQSVALDVTGVGRAVIDLFLHAEIDANLWPRTVVETTDERTDRVYGSESRLDLVANLLVLFQTGKLRIPDELPNADRLQKGLACVRTDGSRGGDGESEDLILAVAWAADLAKASVANDRLFEAYARAYGLDPDEIRRQAAGPLHSGERPNGVYEDEFGNTLTVRSNRRK
jgi:hypothetical protein